MAAETEYDRFEDDDEEILEEDAACEVEPEADEAAGIEGAEAESDDADAEEEELYEVEVDEDAIVGYLVDEDDNEIGFIVEEDGQEVEYYYADEEGVEYVDAEAPAPSKRAADDDDDFDLGITREGVAEATSDANAVFKETVQTAAELKDAIADITEGLSGFNFKKKR